MSRWRKNLYLALSCLLLTLPTATLTLAADDESPTTDKPAAEAADSPDKPTTPEATEEEASNETPEQPTQLYDETANPGIDMLDRALSMRLTAEKLADLAEIASYCEKAIELGLDEFNEDVAKTLLATTLTQRAQFTAKAAFNPGQGRQNWAALRSIAMRDLKKAIENKPDYPEALFLLTELNLLPGGDKKAAVKSLDQILAISNLDPEQYDKALLLRANLEEDLPQKQAFLDKALAENPDNLNALRLRGLTLMAMGKSQEAKADLQRAFELDSENADTCEAFATVLVDLNEVEAAEKVVKKLMELSPDSIAPLTISAQLNAQKKDLAAALDNLNHALELEPTNTGVLLLRAYLYHEMDLPKQAMADVKKVLEIRPQFEQARRFQIALLAQQGDLDKTMTELQKLHEEQPNDPDLTLQLAMLYAMKKESKKAIELYTQLIERDPKNSAALEGRAGLLLGTGKQSEAITDFEKALSLSPDESDILNNLAWVLATSPDQKLRNGKRAIELATKACELTDYKAAHILSTLAAAYAETGDFKQAIKYSTQAVELGKDAEDPETQKALQKELDSYKAQKPWRERLEEGLPAAEE